VECASDNRGRELHVLVGSTGSQDEVDKSNGTEFKEKCWGGQGIILAALAHLVG
jgi:hypothetical protein